MMYIQTATPTTSLEVPMARRFEKKRSTDEHPRQRNPRPPLSHDPGTRELIEEIDGWQLRVLVARTRHKRSRSPIADVQLWHPQASVSLLSPSSRGRDRYEVWTARFGSFAISGAAGLAELVRRLTGLSILPAIRRVSRQPAQPAALAG